MRRLPLLALALVACGRTTPATPAAGGDSAATAGAAPASAEPAPAVAPAERSFSAVLAGFDFRVPTSWGRRYSASERADPADFPGARHAVEFVYLPDEGGVPPLLLTILVYDRARWGAAKRVGDVVRESGDRVFVAVRPEGNPLPAGSPDATRLDATRLSVDEVRERLMVR